MKQYRVTRKGSYIGVYCDVGDIITIKGKQRWTNSEYSGVFVGDIWSVAHAYLELIGDVAGKTDIEIKIDQMWNRQPYMQKKLGIKRKPSKKPYEPFDWSGIDYARADVSALEERIRQLDREWSRFTSYESIVVDDPQEVPEEVDEPDFNFLTR